MKNRDESKLETIHTDTLGITMTSMNKKCSFISGRFNFPNRHYYLYISLLENLHFIL